MGSRLTPGMACTASYDSFGTVAVRVRLNIPCFSTEHYLLSFFSAAESAPHKIRLMGDDDNWPMKSHLLNVSVIEK